MFTEDRGLHAPVMELNRAVPMVMAPGPQAGLDTAEAMMLKATLRDP